VLGTGVVGIGQAVADGALRIVEGTRRLQVHHAAKAALGQFGQRRFVEVDAAEQFGREHVVVEAARRRADGGGGGGVDRRAVQRGDRVFGGQAADRDALAFAGRFVAVQDHARHALQGFGDVRFREFADVFGDDGVAHADCLLLQVKRFLKAGTETGDHHGGAGIVGWRRQRRFGGWCGCGRCRGLLGERSRGIHGRQGKRNHGLHYFLFHVFPQWLVLGGRRLSDDLSQSRLAISTSRGNTARKTFYCAAAEALPWCGQEDFALKASDFVHVMKLKTAGQARFWTVRYADIV